MNNTNADKFLGFRQKYPEFIYKKYKYVDNGQCIDIQYHFSIPGLGDFHPTWSISKSNSRFFDTTDTQLDLLVFSLGMVELISYWKISCPPTVVVENQNLTKDQTEWWKKLYSKGLGEFFYTNGISIGDDFMQIKSSGTKKEVGIKSANHQTTTSTPKVLVPIGGGKDSIVSIELLKNFADRYPYIINPRKATLDTVEVAGLKEKTIVAKRTLDKNMLDLNAKGYLNGHTPFSALVAFSSVIAAYINGLEYVSLSNESSANEATVANSDVNHQYSKSYEFECDFINYELKYINSNIKYFSLLRPLTELQIAKLFAEFKQYHSIFQSCNVGSKTDIWCGVCPKCLFVYIILSPFLQDEDMLKIFNKDMLNDQTLVDTFQKLTGMQLEKPFECVGSIDEVKTALQIIMQKCETNNKPLPYLLQYYFDNTVANFGDCSSIFNYFDTENLIPPYFLSIIKNKVLN